jgi:hypothetical protein
MHRLMKFLECVAIKLHQVLDEQSVDFLCDGIVGPSRLTPVLGLSVYHIPVWCLMWSISLCLFWCT